VAFASLATNFIASDTNNAWDIYLRDTCEGQDPDICVHTTTRVSVDSAGAEANGDSVEPVISSEGRFIAFRSLANNLVGGDTNGAGDIFIRDTCIGVAMGCTPATIRASLANDGSEATGISLRPAISPDGRFVAFESLASNLTGGDTNGAVDIYIRDTCLGAGIGCVPATVRASLADDGSEPNVNSFQASVSGGGRFVAFESGATNLVTGDTNGFSDVFLRDTCLGGPLGCVPSTTRISLGLDEAEFPSISGEPSIDSAGRFIVFTVIPTGFASDDPNGSSEIYVRDTCEGGPVDCVPMTALVSIGPSGERVNGDASQPVISADGTTVAFQSSATDLTINDTDNLIGIFVVDLVELLTPPAP
jgi:Tol biopolymer transport system component